MSMMGKLWRNSVCAAVLMAYPGFASAQEYNRSYVIPPDDAAIMKADMDALAREAKEHDKQEEAEKIPEFKPTGYVEGGLNASRATNDYGNGFGQYVRGEVQTDPKNRWNAEAGHQHKFHENGTYGGIGNTHLWNEDMYTTIGISGGMKGSFLPRTRVDASINRMWREQRLLTTLGYMYFDSMGRNYSNSILLGATYYFPELWILQGGVWLNRSSPGGVNSASGFVGVMYGTNKDQFFNIRFDYGREAYQVINSGNTITDFNSHAILLGWRKWLGENWGFNAQADYYHNPFYNRTGGSLGVFYEF